MEQFAQRLQQLRKQSGLSQEALAEQLGVSRQAVGKWEGGAAMPELEKLLELCRLFDADLNDLLGLERRSGEGAAEEAQAQQAQGFTQEQMELLRQLIRESRQPAAPPAKKKKWPWILAAAALVIGMISAGNWYSNLENRLWNLQNQINNTQNQISGLHASIGSIEINIKETLEQQASILTFSGTEMGTVSFVPRTFTCSLWALPKNRTEQTKVRFSLETDTGTQVVEAAWTGDRYLAQPTMDWCRIQTVTVVVEENGILSSEVLQDVWLDPADEILLSPNGWAAMDTWDTGAQLLVNAGVYMRMPQQGNNQPNTLQMWLESSSGQTVNIPLQLTQNSLSDGVWDYDTQGVVEITLPKQDQTLTLYVRITDSLGCTYDITLCKQDLQWEGGDFSATEYAYPDDTATTVTLPDGSLLELSGSWKY